MFLKGLIFLTNKNLETPFKEIPHRKGVNNLIYNKSQEIYILIQLIRSRCL